jgi:hypothetical protein
MDMNMLNLTTAYSLSDKWVAGAMFMWMDNSMDMKFNSMMATMTGQSGFTMKSRGLGDIMLMAKYRLFADDPLIPLKQSSLILGLSLPTGSIDEKNSTHPVAARQTEQLPYGMQLGSGTLDPTIGVVYGQSSSPWWWGINGMYTARLYDNDRGYRLGDEAQINAWGMFQVSYDFLLQAQLNGRHQGAIRGEMDEASTGASGHVVIGDPTSPYTTPLWNPDNYGGTQLFATVGLQWQPAPKHIIDFQISLPVYQDLNGPQMEADYRAMLTWYIEIPTKKSVRYRGKKPANSKIGF